MSTWLCTWLVLAVAAGWTRCHQAVGKKVLGQWWGTTVIQQVSVDVVLLCRGCTQSWRQVTLGLHWQRLNPVPG